MRYAISGRQRVLPSCALRGAFETQSDSVTDASSELRFEHYQVLRNQDGKPLELGHGGMGVTYKAIDTHLRCPMALKIISLAAKE